MCKNYFSNKKASVAEGEEGATYVEAGRLES
jgi:hypothetical protein